MRVCERETESERESEAAIKVARGSEKVGFAEAAMEILNEIIAPSAPSPRRATSHTRTRAATRKGGRGAGLATAANENIETNISEEILQFSAALNFTWHIKKKAGKLRENRVLLFSKPMTWDRQIDKRG